MSERMERDGLDADVVGALQGVEEAARGLLAFLAPGIARRDVDRAAVDLRAALAFLDVTRLDLLTDAEELAYLAAAGQEDPTVASITAAVNAPALVLDECCG